ncbi:MAG: TlyA family RNA methyltransferase [Candidatus Puniceispirillaceae bacterium]
MAPSGADESPMRADALMVRRGLAASRDRAQALIAEGGVLVDGTPLAKPAKKLPADAEITMTTVDIPWVSRGALKLVGGLEAFPVIDPAGLSCADIGASTGGFTEVLLARGAAHVVAVDVGHGQLHPKLAGDPRVTSREGLNARHLSAEDFATPPQLIVCDASFISLTKVLPVVMDLAAPEALLLALVKPQFEVGRAQIGKGGIVRDRQAVADAVARIEHWLVADMGWELIGTATSPIDGQDGNREFLMAGRKSRNG